MSVISEQIKRLREEAEDIRRNIDLDIPVSIADAKLMEQAADTIETLSQKLRAERWILCNERMPEEHEWIGTKQFGTKISRQVYVTFKTPRGEYFAKYLNFQNGKLSPLEQQKIDACHKGSIPIAWMPLPEPYKESEG